MNDNQQPITGDALAEAMRQTFTSITETLTTTFNALIPIMQNIQDALWTAYREAGRPYGDTPEGLMRWMDDVGKVNRMQAEIEYIRNYHQMLIDARKIGERIYEKRKEQS
jgi:hypothetical protein